MKLRLIGTLTNFTVKDLFDAFPNLKRAVEAYKKLSPAEQDANYESFKGTVSSIVGNNSQQDKFNSSLAYRLIISYATNPNPQPSKKIKLNYKPEPLANKKLDWFGND